MIKRDPIDPDAVYSREEVAELLGVSLSTIKRLISARQLENFRRELRPESRAGSVGVALVQQPVLTRCAVEDVEVQLVGEHLRPGDISTHCFRAPVPWVDAEGKLYPYLAKARERTKTERTLQPGCAGARRVRGMGRHLAVGCLAQQASCPSRGPRAPPPRLGDGGPDERDRHREADRVDCVRIVRLSKDCERLPHPSEIMIHRP